MNSTEEYLDSLLKGITEGPAEEEKPTEDAPIEDIPTEDIPIEDIPTKDISIEETVAEDMPIEEAIEDIPVGDYLTGDFPRQESAADESVSEEGQLLEDEDIAALLKSMGEINLPPEEALPAGSFDDTGFDSTGSPDGFGEAQGSSPSLEFEPIMSADVNSSDGTMEDFSMGADINAAFDESLLAGADTGLEKAPVDASPIDEPFLAEEAFSPDVEFDKEDELFKEEIANGDEFLDEGQAALAEDTDLLDLLAGMSDDAELSEIGELLSKNDNHEMIEREEPALDEEEMPEEDFLSMDDVSEEEETENPVTDKNGKKKRKEKKEKRPGFFSRLFNTLSQEVEEPEEIKQIFAEETAPEIARQGAAENEKILRKMGEEEEEEASQEGKKGKKGKKEKKVKEKAVKEKPIRQPQPPMKKLPKKKVILIAILCFSLGVIMTLLAFIFPYYSDKKNARTEFERQNYEQTYELLRGHKLNEEEQLMYDKSLVLLKAERKYDSYKNYMLLGMKLEALNALIQGVKVTEALRETAAQLGVQEEFDAIRNKIIAELEAAFAVSLEQAYEWLQIDDNQVYSKELDGYVNGTPSEENPDGTAAQQNVQTENPVIKGEEEEFAPTGEDTAEQEAGAAQDGQPGAAQEIGNAENETPPDAENGRSMQNVEELNENAAFDVEGAEGL